MRLGMRRTVAVAVLALAAAVPTGVRAGPDEDGDTPGVRGALLGETGNGRGRANQPRPLPTAGAPRANRGTVAPATTAALTTLEANERLDSISKWLAAHDAKRVEDLKDDQLKGALALPHDAGAAAWLQRLFELAHEEAGKRGLTDDRFPTPAAPDPIPRTRAAMQLSQADLEVLARIVNGETWFDTPYEGKVAVASVVLNRVLSRSYPKTVAAVAHQPWQFSCYNADVRARLYNAAIRPESMKAAREAAAGADPVGGALFYYNPYLVKPSWARDRRFVKRIGDIPRNTHDFYR